MALLQCDFFAESLEVNTSMTVILPQSTTNQIGLDGAPPAPHGARVLYLLHGLSDDHTTWLRRTSIERYVAPLGLAVVMPAVHHSFYTDERHGHAYWTFLTEDLPRVVGEFFRVSSRREDTYVAGLSMGGYGALKWALREPHRFAAAASMSGALDVVGLQRRGERPDLFDRVFGGPPGPSDDLFHLLATADVAGLPPLHVSCGTEDTLLPGSQRFAEAAARAGARVVTDFRPGVHEWDFWDVEIQTILDWLPAPT